MADDLDAAELLMLLDQAEADGWPPHLVERLRALVRADEARLASFLGLIGPEPIARGQVVQMGRDGRIHATRDMADSTAAVIGMTGRDFMPGESARWNRRTRLVY